MNKKTILKCCARCGKLHPYNFHCLIGQRKEGKDRELRTKYIWTKKSLEIRERANYLCEVCRDNGIYSFENLHVHHIESIRDAPEKYLENQNLISLCVHCHLKADRGETDKKYLKLLAEKRESVG